MIKFRDFINQTKQEQQVQNDKQIIESVDVAALNASGIGYIVSKTLAVAAQVHIWHLLAKSGQKHSALGSFYDALETEVDLLAEKFLAIGGTISDFSFNFSSSYSDTDIILAMREYRDEVSDTIFSVKDSADLQSVLDGLTDLQEDIDQFIYRFKLD